MTAANAAIATNANLLLTRVCGRHFDTNGAGTGTNISICSRTRPFRVRFVTDSDEVTNTAATTVGSELHQAPGGTIGFSLIYTQFSC